MTKRIVVPCAALVSAALYAVAAAHGDLRDAAALYVVVHAALLGLMLVAWRAVRTGAAPIGVVLAAALLFRIVAAWGEPMLSDDVYRYVWDGRVQVHGFHPYRFAPSDPALQALRDASSEQINHPELRTIYPPLAQVFFAALASLGAGVRGFKLASGVLDFAVVLALLGLLRRSELPRDRVVLYAWNPLAVVETAGSGHLEPLGVLLVILAESWIIDRRFRLSTIALAGAVQAKLLPLVLLPLQLRRVGIGAWVPFATVSALIVVPYALTGPAVGAGLFAYAARWEHNASIFAIVRSMLEAVDSGSWLGAGLWRLREALGHPDLPWELWARWAWPPELGRLIVGVAALGWIAWVTWAERGLVGPRKTLWILGGALILAPTLHPWYLLWALPLAAALASPGWLTLAALVPLSYLSGGGDVSWAVRACEYLPALFVGLLARRASSGRRDEPEKSQ